MKKVELCFEMCYENSPHTKIVEVDDNITDEELEEMTFQMVLDYANTWHYEVEEESEE